MADDSFVFDIVIDLNDSSAGIAALEARLRALNQVIADPAIGRAADNLGSLGVTAGKASKSITTLNGETYKSTKALETASKQTAIYNQYLFDQQKATQRGSQVNNANVTSLLRVATTLGIVGVVLVGTTAAIVGAGVAWDKNFANVIRTSNPNIRDSAVLLDTLKKNFQDLASSIPVTAEDLAKIGTLGNQLGISGSQLTAFTKIVAEFSATSGLSVDEAATAFGRLKALLPDVSSGKVSLEQLSSGILKVGVNSVATESQIAKTAVQISAMSRTAGLSAANVIGLAGALASIGVQPELARGTITRLFTQMQKAVSGGGAALQNFADVSGVSASKFASSFGTKDFGNVLLGFFSGLQKKGGDANQTLAQLGITSVRDRPALLNLANAADNAGKAGGLIAQTFADANKGIKDNTETSEQYSKIAGTVAAKLELVGASFNNLVVAIGQGGGVFAGALDLLNGFLKTLTDIARNPVTNTLLQITLLVGGLLGVLTLLAAGAVASVAGITAITAALQRYNVVGGESVGVTAGLTASFAGLGTAGKVLGLAMLAGRAGVFGLVAALSIAFDVGFAEAVVNGLNSISDAARGFSNDIDSVNERLATSKDADYQVHFHDNGFASFLGDIERNLANVGLAQSQGARDFKQFDTQLSQLAQNGNISAVKDQLKQVAIAQGVTVKQLLKSLPDTQAQLDLVAASSGKTSKQLLDQADATDVATAAAQSLATSIGLVDTEQTTAADQLASYQDALGKSADGFLSLGDAITASTDKGTFSLKKFNQILQDQLTALANYKGNLLKLVAAGVDQGVISQLVAAGPAAAQAVQGIVDDLKGAGQTTIALLSQYGAAGGNAFATSFTDQQGTIDEAFKQGGQGAAIAMRDALVSNAPGAVQDVIDKFNLILADQPLKVQADTKPAVSTIDAALARYTGGVEFPVYANTTPAAASIQALYAKYLPTGLPVQLDTSYTPRKKFQADGGPIFGPGSGTSDSIAAQLSNGEYVIRAASVRKYGMGLFDQLNRGVAHFASGGPVGGSSASFPSSMMTSWGPTERNLIRALAGMGGLSLKIGDKDIAQAANRGNEQLGREGKR